jgi:hypothetical protein
VVFYCRRQVCQLQDPLRAAELLDGPLEAYLFVPADEWERIREGVRSPTREAGRHWDLYARREVLVVTNR